MVLDIYKMKQEIIGMGIWLVVIVENKKGLTQEQVNEALGVEVFHFEGKEEVEPRWKIFEWNGKSYASWIDTPRVFEGLNDLIHEGTISMLEHTDPLEKVDEEARQRWESLRKYLVRVREVLGNGNVYLGNDILYHKLPEDAEAFKEEFTLPWELPEVLLEEPDYNKYPELKDIKELEYMIW